MMMKTSAADYAGMCDDYRLVEQAIRFLEENYQRQPTLAEIAASVHLSESHFQRLFSRWVGISPKRFLQFLTKESAKRLLEDSASILEAAYATGLSGPGRLHDLFVTCEAVTPGEYKQRGAGLTVHYGIHPTPFGKCLLAVTERGICGLAFVEADGTEDGVEELGKRWPRASLVNDQAVTAPVVERIFRFGDQRGSLRLYLNGTNFQIKVWEALLRIPAGYVVSYQQIAAFIGHPEAARSVGSAVAENPIPVLVPCHRVIRKEGLFGEYRYGSARKKALLGWEMAKAERLATK